MVKFYSIAIIAISCISIVELSPEPGFFSNIAKQFEDVRNDGKQWIHGLGIFPGTKWCGPGNIAKNFDDLGKNEEVDKCCRSHDHCPHRVLSGETKYNFTNDMRFTVSDCECEKKLKTCLNSFNETTLSSINLIKVIYFAVKTQCFTLVNGEAVLMDSSKYQE